MSTETVEWLCLVAISFFGGIGVGGWVASTLIQRETYRSSPLDVSEAIRRRR